MNEQYHPCRVEVGNRIIKFLVCITGVQLSAILKSKDSFIEYSDYKNYVF